MDSLVFKISYDGTGFMGWQKQPGFPTIQGCLEEALVKLTKRNIKTMASGRTDAGVHALAQWVSIDTIKEHEILKFNWVKGVNRFLPPEIRVLEAYSLTSDFHPLRSSLDKTYSYKVHWGHSSDPISSRFSHWVYSKPNFSYLNSLSKIFIGAHDFRAFQTTGTPVKSTVREIYASHWLQTGAQTAEYTVTGNGFLKQMVRNLVGTMVHNYWDKPLRPEDITTILKTKSRASAYGTAPARGLFLKAVNYPHKFLTFQPLNSTK